MSGKQLTYENIFKVFLINKTMSIYFLFGLITLQDFLRLLVSFCTRSEDLGAETLELTSLLLPDPGGIMGLLLALMTDCGCGTSLCTLMKTSLVFLAGWLLNTTGVVC